MRKSLTLAVVILLVAFPLFGQQKENERLEECAAVLKEILDVPDNIPQELIDRAECVVVFPAVKKFAIGIGASYGRGAITCRSGKDFTGPWSAPSMFALEGGNIGFQLGGQSTDFVLLVMNPKGAESIMGSKVKLGVDAAASAGPKGRNAAAATDVVMRAEILSYSRSRGLFAGVSLEGSTLRTDGGANENIYGKEFTTREIVRDGAVQPTNSAKYMLDILNRKSPENLSTQ